MKVLTILLTILSAIGSVWSFLKIYKKLYYLGIFYKTKYKPTENKHMYGICIPAHNEEKVIKNLLDSIQNQDFPKDKMVIFVVADNSTDKTAEIAREFASNSEIKTIVYEHNNPKEKTKGYALKYLFEQMALNNEKQGIEGFFIFDADNVLAKDYITRMNEAFDQGYEAVTSFRNSKNYGQNWISFSYATHWLKTCLLEHRGKNILKLSCRIQGTGFVFKEKYVRDGWNYTSLTEDRAFCSDIVVKGGGGENCLLRRCKVLRRTTLHP